MSKYVSFFGLGDDGLGDDEDHGAPLVYLGSHVEPKEDHPRGGFLDLAYMPDYCADPEGPVPYLRLGIAEDALTYHGMHEGQADLILDRKQVAALRDALSEWLTREDWDK